MKTYPQGQVWVRARVICPLLSLICRCQGGTITYDGTALDAVTAATANFYADVTDPKAAIITNFNSVAGQVCFEAQICLAIAHLVSCNTGSTDRPSFLR